MYACGSNADTKPYAYSTSDLDDQLVYRNGSVSKVEMD
jgi:hypothetical protein